MADIKLPVMAVALPSSLWTIEGGFVPWFVRRITNAASEALRKDGYLAPVANVLGFASEDETQLVQYVVSLAWFMEHDRDAMERIMPELLQRLRAFVVVTATETWTLDGDQDYVDREYEKYPSLADHPDSIEAMSIMVETHESAALHSYPILRDAEGQITLGEDQFAGKGPCTVRGRMANWLQPMPVRGEN